MQKEKSLKGKKNYFRNRNENEIKGINFNLKLEVKGKTCFLRYTFFALLFLMFSFAPSPINTKISPYSLALFFSLAYVGCSVTLLTPIYVLTSAIANPSIENLIVCIACPIIILVSYLVHTKVNHGITLTETNILALLISFLGVGLTEIIITDALIFCGIMLFCLNAGIITFKALILRRINYKMSADELVSVFITAGIFFMGLFSINIYGIYPYFIFAGFILILTLDLYGFNKALMLALLQGFAAFFATKQLGYASMFACGVIVAMIFIKSSLFISILALNISIIGVSFVNKFLVIDEMYAYLYISFGSIVYYLLPHKVKLFFAKYSEVGSDNSSRDIVNRNRYELSKKLNKVSTAFLNISGNVKNSIKRRKGVDEKISDISELIERELCSACILYEDCVRRVGDPKEQFKSLVIGAKERGEPSMMEVSEHLARNCHNVNQAMALATKLTQSYIESLEEMDVLSGGKLLIAEHAREVSALINRISENINGNIVYNTAMEQNVKEKLSHNNIICSDAIIYTDSFNILHMQLTLRNMDVERRELLLLLSQAAKRKMIIKDVNSIIYNGLLSVEFVSSPKYELLYSSKVLAKKGNKVSGDTKSIRKIGEDKVLIALSDGMGNGENAEKYSNTAIGLIESFYDAGFEDSTAIALCNKLLAMGNEDNFSAMDISLIDLRSGKIDYIKLGAPPSFLIQNNSIEIIENSSLPIGIMNSIYPKITTRILKDKDLLLFVSDGIYDTLGEEALRRIISLNKAITPDKIVDAIDFEMQPYLNDDSSVICVRVMGRSV